MDKLVITLEKGAPTVVADLHERGLIETKRIELQEALRIFRESSDSPAVRSGLLPPDCVGFNVDQDGTWEVFLRRRAGYADITCEGEAYPHFPLPDMVFGFRFTLGQWVRSVSLAVPGKEPEADAPLYRYPFSNLYSNGTFCLGNNLLPCCKSLTQLPQIMELVLALPNNQDFYRKENNRKNLSQTELYQYLKDKTPEIYMKEILVPSKGTLGDFLAKEK